MEPSLIFGPLHWPILLFSLPPLLFHILPGGDEGKKTKNKPSLSLSDSPSVLVFSDPETEKMSFISLQISQYVLLHCNGKESRRHRSSVTVSDLVKLTHVPNGKASSDKKSADFTVEISCDSHTGATFKASER